MMSWIEMLIVTGGAAVVAIIATCALLLSAGCNQTFQPAPDRWPEKEMPMFGPDGIEAADVVVEKCNVHSFADRHGIPVVCDDDLVRHLDFTGMPVGRQAELIGAWCAEMGGDMPIAINGQERPYQCR